MIKEINPDAIKQDIRPAKAENPHAHLLEELRRGSHSAYKELYFKWSRPIFLLLKKLTGSDSEAEDITQEVFVTLWESRDRIDPSKDIKSFLYLIARQSASKFFRRAKVRDNYLSNGDFNSDERVNSYDIVVAKETELLIEMAAARMPEQRRMIFELSYKKTLSNAQIAELMKIPSEVVAKQLFLARKHIKTILHIFVLVFLDNNM